MEDDLPPTKTYKWRHFRWVPAGPLIRRFNPGTLGTLVIQLSKSLTGKRIETDTYSMQEEPNLGKYGRQFLLLNMTDPTQQDVYHVVIGPMPRCTCDAGRAKLRCKHLDSIQTLLAYEPTPEVNACAP